jgi:hypothetical protein
VNGHKPRPSPELRGEVLLALSERRYADARTFMHERAAFNWLPEQEMLGVREGGVA